MLATFDSCAALADFHPIDTIVRRLRSAIDSISEEHWSGIAAPDANEPYLRLVLIDTPELLVIAARWRGGAHGDLHGHSESAGLYRIVSGALEEERYLPDGRSYKFEREELGLRAESYLPRGAFHQLRAVGDSISVHAYAPRPDEASSDPSDDERAKLDAARSAALFGTCY